MLIELEYSEILACVIEEDLSVTSIKVSSLKKIARDIEKGSPSYVTNIGSESMDRMLRRWKDVVVYKEGTCLQVNGTKKKKLELVATNRPVGEGLQYVKKIMNSLGGKDSWKNGLVNG